MGPNIETFIESTRKVATPAALKKLFLSEISDQGYENAVFARTNNRRLVSVPWSEFPPGYLDTYRAEEWDRIDPVVQRVHAVRGPFKWSDTSPPGGFNRQQRNFFESCRELGVQAGITIPIRGKGQEIDLISLSLRVRDDPPADGLAQIYMLSLQYWLTYYELSDRRDEKAVQLTPQEVECLRWCKEGKTNWEIGEILKISEKTVEFHLSNGMRKLGAGNRITAVIMAIKCGLISL